MIQVSLISYTPYPERTIAARARISASLVGTMEIMKRLVPRLVDCLIPSGYLSTYKHDSFTFAIESIPRYNNHQMVRHHIASFNEFHPA
jgi:thymidylate synthase (FAD)